MILLPIQKMKNNSLKLVGKQLQTKRKGKQISKKIKRNSFRMSPLSEKIPKSLTNYIKDTVALGITQNLKKSDSLQMFYQIGVLKIFTKFTGKRLFQSLFQIKLQALGKKRLRTGVFLCGICKIFKKTFFTEQLRWLFPPQRKTS